MPIKKESKVKEVSTEPKVKLEKQEELIEFFVDPEMVSMQGIQINGKRYIGKVMVTRNQAQDLKRIMSEYWETQKKLVDPKVSVRMKNDFQKEALFLANPKDNEGKKGFTRDYGLLGDVEWSYCTDGFKAHLLEQRKQMYGY